MLASQRLKEFQLTITDLVLDDWLSANFNITIVHQPTSQKIVRHVSISKDDYLLVREDISGRRTDFLERDPKVIAKFLLSRAKIRYHRRFRVKGSVPKPVTMGICIEQIQIADWDRKELKFISQ